ncbi:MAG: ABC transporter ATP-binding protein [Gammaproteobacteria bacterium]
MNEKELAISVKHVGKRYRIGEKEQVSDTFGGMLMDSLKSPIKNYRKYKSLYSFNDVEAVDERIDTENVLWALKDISFEVTPGEVLGIIGTNGAGKSTLLKVLSRITQPTCGEIEIHGRVSSLLEVGTGFHQELTGRENIYLNGTVLGMTKKEIDSKFDEIVDFSGVEKFLDTPVKRYSSGMRVRLAFAVAAHLEPEILVVDEVLAVGDAAFQRKCLNKMQDIGEGGRTVLFVSHSMPAITRLCQRAVLLKGGNVLKDGPTHDVVGAYLNEGGGSPAIKEWGEDEGAPGGEIVKLSGVRIRNKEGKVSEAIDITQPVSIEMEYVVLQDGYQMMPHFHIFNEEGVRVFVALDQDPEWQGKNRPAGRYISKVWIPGNLLSNGTLYVSPALLTLEPNIPQFLERDIVSFHVIDNAAGEAGSARGNYSKNIKGVIRPLLDWETSSIG